MILSNGTLFSNKSGSIKERTTRALKWALAVNEMGTASRSCLQQGGVPEGTVH